MTRATRTITGATALAVLTCLAAATLAPAAAHASPANEAPAAHRTTAASTPVASEIMSARALPYTLQVDYLSGADNGIRTPELATNASGRICLAPNLYVSQNADGKLKNDNRYYAHLWHKKTLKDGKVGATLVFDVASEPKRCWTGVPKNVTVYVRLHKTNFISGQLLAGQGRLTYS